ncbi:MAG: AraC family transcriptional regulator [Paenibacillaceae bacterium]|nr:AraC family transcriptional regulator [Paenibacillaceae bacterium]
MKEFIKHLMVSSYDQQLPFYMESIGSKERQTPYNRPEGYPYYHWLQTIEGSGEFRCADRLYTLQPGEGILLAPGVPHRYEGVTDKWTTIFVTFGGAMIQSVISSMQLRHSGYYRLTNPELLVQTLQSAIHKVKWQANITSLDMSAELYQFLVQLKKHGLPSNHLTNAFSYEPLNRLLQWMEAVYSEPDIGLTQMAEQLHISKQHLMSIFRKRFGCSPYAYFVQLRINKAKELFAMHPELSVKEVSGQVGFNDVSHFVATFRRLTRMTPETFKNMYSIR